MLSIKQMQICTGLNLLIPCNNESKSSRNLCYSIFSFIVLVPEPHERLGEQVPPHEKRETKARRLTDTGQVRQPSVDHNIFVKFIILGKSRFPPK